MVMPWSVCSHSGPGRTPPPPTPHCVQNVQWSVFHFTTGYLGKVYLSVAVHHCSSVIIVPQFIFVPQSSLFLSHHCSSVHHCSSPFTVTFILVPSVLFCVELEMFAAACALQGGLFSQNPGAGEPGPQPARAPEDGAREP